jgi:hypothetical protein
MATLGARWIVRGGAKREGTLGIGIIGTTIAHAIFLHELGKRGMLHRSNE